MSLKTKREIGDQRKEFNELTKDLNFKNQSAIPNSFLHQPDAERTRWMLKRGKDKMVYYDNDQILKMKKYFEELDTDRSGKSSLFHKNIIIFCRHDWSKWDRRNPHLSRIGQEWRRRLSHRWWAWPRRQRRVRFWRVLTDAQRYFYEKLQRQLSNRQKFAILKSQIRQD